MGKYGVGCKQKCPIFSFCEKGRCDKNNGYCYCGHGNELCEPKANISSVKLHLDKNKTGYYVTWRHRDFSPYKISYQMALFFGRSLVAEEKINSSTWKLEHLSKHQSYTVTLKPLMQPLLPQKPAVEGIGPNPLRFKSTCTNPDPPKAPSLRRKTASIVAEIEVRNMTKQIDKIFKVDR